MNACADWITINRTAHLFPNHDGYIWTPALCGYEVAEDDAYCLAMWPGVAKCAGCERVAAERERELMNGGR